MRRYCRPNSIDYYLKHDKRYLGKKLVAFKAVDPKTGIEISDDNGGKKRKDHYSIHISIRRT